MLLLAGFLLLVDWRAPLPRGVVGGAAFYSVALLSMAVAPGLTLVLFLYYRDRFYDESWRLLGRLFLWAVLLCPVAALVEHLLDSILYRRGADDSLASDILYYFCVVAFCEELVKFSVVYVLAYRKSLFKQVYDGVLFGAAAALGLATLENILYVFTGGYDALGIAVGRALTAVPSHVVDGVVMGYALGRASRCRGRPEEKEWIAKGLVSAVLLHGVYDLLLVQRFAGFAPMFILLLVATSALAWRLVRQALRATPFTRCRQCRGVHPGIAGHCPWCGIRRETSLRCSWCNAPISVWARICCECRTRVRLPDHLQVQRLGELFRGRSVVECGGCAEQVLAAPYCLHCGEGLGGGGGVGGRARTGTSWRSQAG